MTAKDLYDRDFFEWTRSNAALLRAGRFEEIDAEHLAEEVAEVYGVAVSKAAAGTRLPETRFPGTCPFSPD